MSVWQQEPMTIKIVGSVSTPEEVQAVLDAAALRDDIDDLAAFHKKPFAWRQQFLGIKPVNQEV